MKKFYNLVAGLISVSNSWFNKCSYWTWISKLPSLSSKERYSRIAQMVFLIFLNISICSVDIRNVILLKTDQISPIPFFNKKQYI